MGASMPSGSIRATPRTIPSPSSSIRLAETSGGGWAPEHSSEQPFNPFFGYPNQNKMGDYISMVSDNAGGDVAYSATFNGEQDVYYVRVAPLASRLLNISTRARVGTGQQVLIAGFVIGGTGSEAGHHPRHRSFAQQFWLNRIVIQSPHWSCIAAIPTLATNDNWKTESDGMSQQAQVEATGTRADEQF